MTEYREPGELVLGLFDKIVNWVKSTRPIATDGKPLTTGFVYSQLPLGMPIDPEDYLNPWSPHSGVTVAESAAVVAEPVGAGQPAAGETAPVAPDMTKEGKALDAAFKIAQLADMMIMVTNDGTFVEYPASDRHISAAYETIINGMQSEPMPPVSPQVQKQIDDATKILYELDEDDGSIVGKSKLYKTYRKNSEAYAQAKFDYADAQEEALKDPAKAASFPMKSVLYQQKVDEAWDDLKSEGGDKVEGALKTLEAVGICMQNYMIAKSRKVYDAYNLGLAGVPTTTPYAYITPRNWCDPDDDDGFVHLTVTQKSFEGHDEFHSWNTAQAQASRDSSWSGGGGGFSIFGFGASGKGGTSSWDFSNSYQAGNGTRYEFHNDAKNLSISLEYGLATINRPFLLGDLFYLRNWYLVNSPKNAISDGTIQNQVGKAEPLLPMIPEQFLVIRNVHISASKADWGADGQTLNQMYQDSQAQGNSWEVGGSAGFSLGFFSIGGSGGHSESHASSNFHSIDTHDSESNFGWSFDGENLWIRGAQIVAFLSDIVPACPPEPDPGLH